MSNYWPGNLFETKFCMNKIWGNGKIKRLSDDYLHLKMKADNEKVLGLKSPKENFKNGNLYNLPINANSPLSPNDH